MTEQVIDASVAIKWVTSFASLSPLLLPLYFLDQDLNPQRACL